MHPIQTVVRGTHPILRGTKNTIMDSTIVDFTVMYIVYVLQRCVFHCQTNIFTNKVDADIVETDKDDNEDG